MLVRNNSIENLNNEITFLFSQCPAFANMARTPLETGRHKQYVYNIKVILIKLALNDRAGLKHNTNN